MIIRPGIRWALRNGLKLCLRTLCFLAVIGGGLSAPLQENSARRLVSLESLGLPNVFRWEDTCNVYVFKEGERALLVDLGDGSVLDHLHTIGVREVDWVLFTHHHREQCQGYPALEKWNVKIGVPEGERLLFERPLDFRKMNPRLQDRYTIHGASYVRPPIQPIPVDRAFAKMDTLDWQGNEIWCVETRGNSPGSMSYIFHEEDLRVAFSGDVMVDGARMHTWFDTEWDYGFASGIYALHGSAALLADYDLSLMLPSHGQAVLNPASQLRIYQEKLRGLAEKLVRGYSSRQFSSSDQDRVSRPSGVPHVWQVSEHIYKFKGPNYSPNFTIIIADSGHALVVDCGLIDPEFLDRSLELMQERLGLRQIDAVLISHMHGDHMLQAPHLRQKWGAEIWVLDRMVDQIEHPEWFDYAAPIQAYRAAIESVRPDRILSSGEILNWEGYRLTADWMPGQTEFAMGLHGVIDGKKVVFTGDNLFANPEDPEQTGHEAVVAHNSSILEEGYIYGAKLLSRIEPDLLIGGHSWVMAEPARLIGRFLNWAHQMRTAFQLLANDEDYEYWYDPFWVRAEPYRLRLEIGVTKQVKLNLRNFRSRSQQHSIEIHAPSGLQAEPSLIEGALSADSREAASFTLKALSGAPVGKALVAFDITLDGDRYGELFDMIVEIEEQQ